MSGIAAAKKRRAGVSSSTPDQPRLPNGGTMSVQQQPSSQGLTLQQVIALFDTRINKVEKFMSDFGSNEQSGDLSNKQLETLPSNISEILDDFQQKFIILAGEINSLKDTVLKLQTYTMEVNKVLLEDRIQILSDFGENMDDRFLLETDIPSNDGSNNGENTTTTFIFDTLDSKIENSLEK